jgi:hypothetical protein
MPCHAATQRLHTCDVHTTEAVKFTELVTSPTCSRLNLQVAGMITHAATGLPYRCLPRHPQAVYGIAHV